MEQNSCAKQFLNSCKQFRSLVIQIIGIDHCVQCIQVFLVLFVSIWSSDWLLFYVCHLVIYLIQLSLNRSITIIDTDHL